MTAALAKLDPHIFVIIGYLRTMLSFVILWHVVGQLCWFEAGSGGGGLIFNDWSDQAGHQATNHHSDDEDDNDDDEHYDDIGILRRTIMIMATMMGMMRMMMMRIRMVMS